MGAVYVYEPYKHTQSSPSNTWNIVHNFGREVNPIIYILGEDTGDGYEEVFAEIEIIDNNSLTVKFYEKGSLINKVGYVVVS